MPRLLLFTLAFNFMRERLKNCFADVLKVVREGGHHAAACCAKPWIQKYVHLM